jgi:hypothetical protein
MYIVYDFRVPSPPVKNSGLRASLEPTDGITIKGNLGARGGAFGWDCATSRKVAGSIPDGVIGIFYWHNSSGRTMALGYTQLLTEMSIRNIFGGKGGRCVRLTTLPPFMSRLSWNMRALTSWNPQGLSRLVMGLLLFVIYTGDKLKSTSYWKYLCRRFSACLSRFAEWLLTLSLPSTVLLLSETLALLSSTKSPDIFQSSVALSGHSTSQL